MKVTFPFRPIEIETLKLARRVYDENESDPVAAYGRLLSAAMVAGAMLNLTPQQVGHQATEFLRLARRAVQERPDIFGSEE